MLKLVIAVSYSSLTVARCQSENPKRRSMP